MENEYENISQLAQATIEHQTGDILITMENFNPARFWSLHLNELKLKQDVLLEKYPESEDDISGIITTLAKIAEVAKDDGREVTKRILYDKAITFYRHWRNPNLHRDDTGRDQLQLIYGTCVGVIRDIGNYNAPRQRQQEAETRLEEATALPIAPRHTPREVYQTVRRGARPERVEENTRPIETQNRFATLQEEEREEEAETQHQQEPEEEERPQSGNGNRTQSNYDTQFPPIMVIGKETSYATIKNINNQLPGKCQFKTTAEGLKIHAGTRADNNKVMEICKQAKLQFYTWQPRNERANKFVIRGLPIDTPAEDIRVELESRGYTINLVTQMTKRQENINRFLPLFLISLPPSDRNKNIKNEKHLLYMTVRIENFNSSTTITQCYRCQKIGHTWHNCHINPRCVICAGAHSHKDCPGRGNPDAVIKCCNCNSHHTANYKGCQYFRTEKEKRKTGTGQNRRPTGREAFEEAIRGTARYQEILANNQQQRPAVELRGRGNGEEGPRNQPGHSRGHSYADRARTQTQPQPQVNPGSSNVMAEILEDPELKRVVSVISDLYQKLKRMQNPMDKLHLTLEALEHIDEIHHGYGG